MQERTRTQVRICCLRRVCALVGVNMLVLAVLVAVFEGASALLVPTAGDNLIADYYLNHTWRPNSEWEHNEWINANPDFSRPYRHHYNKQAWLEQYDVEKTKGPNVYRIFYLGDSFVEGTCPMDESVPSKVEARLNELARGMQLTFEVINTGTSSYSPTLYYLLARHRLMDYHPDLLVVNVDMTDCFDDWKYAQTLVVDAAGAPFAAPPRDVMPKAKEAALEAVKLDPSLAEGHTSLGYILLSYDWDLDGARRQFVQAIGLNPGYATAHHWYAHYWLAMAQPQKALEEIGKAQLLDPQSLVINAGVGWFRYHAHRYGAAIEQYRNTLKIAPDFALGHVLLGMAYEQNAAYSDAEVEFNTARDLQGSPTLALAGLGRAYALAGRRREAQRVADRLEHPSPKRYVPSVYIAAVYAAMGEKDRAIGFTERALDERSDYMIYLNTDPWAEPLRDDPRFREILRTVAQGRR